MASIPRLRCRSQLSSPRPTRAPSRSLEWPPRAALTSVTLTVMLQHLLDGPAQLRSDETAAYLPAYVDGSGASCSLCAPGLMGKMPHGAPRVDDDAPTVPVGLMTCLECV